ncbi:MAG: polyhydroxyalkanoate depolymerase [Alphaproteobacteria bacterium]|nr:polyhydroxyalkanoate depolymerase [Alphaproteobacteria bacterium]
MLYQSYQNYTDTMEPLRSAARNAVAMADMIPGFHFMGLTRNMTAFWEISARSHLSHTRPDYNIDHAEVGKERVAVQENVVLTHPFCNLLHFAKDGISDQPKMLLIAPLSGHFATLLRPTIETLLCEHDVYITDWKNARDVAPSQGVFGFDDHTDFIIECIETLGPDTHVFAVCQPSVQALAAVALMEEDNHPAIPASLTLMAGPIDTRVSPNAVNKFATSHPIEWFEKNVVSQVPFKFEGGGRAVYPGFLQLSGFMSMNSDKHAKAHRDLFGHLVKDQTGEAETITSFYDEYCSVLDLTAEFFLDTIETVFHDHRIAKGELTHRGHKVDPAAIKRTTLLTIEGERDDICSIGQTSAAHGLCSSLPTKQKHHHLQAGVGHYGTFSGRRWNEQIYPEIKKVVQAAS